MGLRICLSENSTDTEFNKHEDESMLTPRQNDVVGAIARLRSRLGYAPTICEIAEETGMSPTRARQHIDKLQEIGVVEKEISTARSIRILEHTTH
jgi:SOS-response transcriptional repressor LexA